MDTVEEKLREMGLELPSPPESLARYAPAKLVDRMVYCSGQLPLERGRLMHAGSIGREVTVTQGRRCAAQCVLRCLAAARGVLGELDRIEQIVQVRGFVNSAPGFSQQTEVLNGASELLVELFGENGRHARAAVGACGLPLDAPVELEMQMRVGP